MVDLTLKPFPGQAIPKDVYVALRIGESQKLGRISSERLYRFPRDAVGDHKYGKVEVLKKVSGLTVGVNPDTHAQQDITVPFENEILKFKVHVKDPKDGSPKAQQAKDLSKMGKENRPKVKAARKYLDDHNLELRLKDAMQEVIRIMPAEPAAFIGRWLASNANTVTKPFVPAPHVGEDEQPEAKAPLPAMPPKPMPDATPDAEDGRMDAELAKLNKSAPPVPDRSPALGAEELNESAPPVPERSLAPSAEESSKSVPPVPERSPDAEELRMQAKASLLGAVSTGRLDEALASVRIAKSVPDSEAALRETAKKTLLGAAASGSLDGALADLKVKLRSMEDLRQQAKASLFAAAASGSLDSALASLRRDEPVQLDPEELRIQAKATLLEATGSGRLSVTLANMKKGKSAPHPEELRQHAKKALLDATSTGCLDESLAQVKQGKNESDPESLRKMAGQALLDATNSGRLDDVVSNLKRANVAKGDPDVEQLRDKAKQVLLQGISTGKLDEAMKLVQVPSDFYAQHLRTKAKEVLISSTKDGSLKSVLGSLKISAPDTEALRQEAKKNLLRATSTGQLDSVLADVKRNQPAQYGMEDLRKQAVQALLVSVESGEVQNILQTVQPDAEDVDVGSLGQQAKSLLLDAACDGRLDTAFSSAIKPTLGNTEDLRLQAKKILKDSVQTGKLDTVSGSFGDKSVQHDDEELRQQVRATLLEASFGGHLETTLAQVKSTSTDTNVSIDVRHLDALRLQARETLISASKTGTLDAALGKLRKTSDPEDLRLQVKGVMLRAFEDGSVDNTLAAVKAGDDGPQAADVEKLHTQASATLLDGMPTGKLEQAMSDLRPSSDAETLRQNVEKVLLGAASDGRLESRLKELKHEAQPSSDESVQEVREKVQRVLIAASQDGTLETVDAGVTMAPTRPVANRSNQMSVTPNSPRALNMDLLRTQLADGLRDTIKDTVKGAVGSVVKSAVDDLKHELAKHDVKQAALADQMNELQQQVTELQTLSNDGHIDLTEFKSAVASGTLGGSS